MSEPQPRRALFGYPSDAVRQLLEDRVEMFERVAEEARAAEDRVRELEAALEVAERELDGGAQELGAMLEEMETLRSELEATRLRLAETEAAMRDLQGLKSEIRSLREERDENAEQAEAASRRATTAEERIRELEAELRSKAEQPAEAGSALTSELERSDREVASLRMELDESRHEIASLTEELRGTRAELAEVEREREGSADPGASSAGGDSPPEEIGRLLRSTEEAVARIVEEGKTRSEHGLREAERARARALEETSRLQAWLDDVAPVVRDARLTLADAEERANELHDRIRASLDPIAEALSSLGGSLHELASAPEPSRGHSESRSTRSPDDDHRVIELRERAETTAQPTVPQDSDHPPQ